MEDRVQRLVNAYLNIAGRWQDLRSLTKPGQTVPKEHEDEIAGMVDLLIDIILADFSPDSLAGMKVIDNVKETAMADAEWVEDPVNAEKVPVVVMRSLIAHHRIPLSFAASKRFSVFCDRYRDAIL